MEITKKLSTATAFGKAPAIRAALAACADGVDSVHLYRIIGMASGTKAGESANGEWCAVMGQFKSHRVEVVDGKETVFDVVSGQCFLPDAAMNLVSPVVSGLDRGESMEFAFDIGARTDAASATGYIFTCSPVIAPDSSDPLAMLEQKIQAAKPADEKPKGKDAAKK